MARKSWVVKVEASELVALGVESKNIGEIAAAFLDTKPPLKPGEEPIIYDLTEALQGWVILRQSAARSIGSPVTMMSRLYRRAWR